MAYTTIDDPSAYFQIATYTGDGNDNRAITNDGNSDLQPDWIWFKNRSTTNSHNLLDSSRGVTKRLRSDDNSAEATVSTRLKSFDSDGMTISTDPSVNGNTNSIVAWQWKANGGTTTSVSATGTGHESTMAGTHQANTTAGFSIVTFSTASEDLGDKLVTHGLGKKPEVIIIKERDGTANWFVHHVKANTNDSQYLQLNTTGATAQTSSRNSFDTSNITTTQFGVDHDNIVNDNKTYVAYCFAPIQGYSKFGSYTGNGNSDGSFIYTGFKPALVILKRSSGIADWNIFDNKRPNAFNEANGRLRTNDNTAESTSDAGVDLLSNGFKCRLGSEFNASATTNIYMAFAEHPFVGSDGVPTTAR